MKKILFLCFILVSIICISTVCADDEDRYNSVSSDVIDKFIQDMPSPSVAGQHYRRLANCLPTKLKMESGVEQVYGKTKKGTCHFSTFNKNIENGKIAEKRYDCYVPMSVALGYGTTSIDILDYSQKRLDKLAGQRLGQLMEISQVMLDYCTVK